ncbi:MAG: translation elongation factor Ts [Leptospiraceae bacterium]|nr:translation elongation factor Ts [Leptospiraceae bacterium]MCP5494596.1 translation elongation factor Ts [Leptospiraceae bacterium]
MSTPTEQIKELRERTGAGMLDCKKALAECNNSIEKAVDFLREKGLAKAAKKASRETKEGTIVSYVHNGKIGVLLELNCETDFVAKNEEFQALGNEICLQITGMNPSYVKIEDVPSEIIEKESKIIRANLLEQGKKEEILDKIVPGKLQSLYSEICLLEQKFFKDGNKTINDLIQDAIMKFGENITIGRFTRYQIGG